MSLITNPREKRVTLNTLLNYEMNSLNLIACFILLGLPFAEFYDSIDKLRRQKDYNLLSASKNVGKKFSAVAVENFPCTKSDGGTLSVFSSRGKFKVMQKRSANKEDGDNTWTKKAKNSQRWIKSESIRLDKNLMASTFGEGGDKRRKEKKTWKRSVGDAIEAHEREDSARKGNGRKLFENVPTTSTEIPNKTLEATSVKMTLSRAKENEATTPLGILEPEKTNETGSYLGAPCESTCSKKLLHVVCDPTKRKCECENKYPVQVGIDRGCEMPKELGDQCFYAETCSFFDSNADCVQINHNAICQCKPGFHTVALRKGVKRMFCSEDIAAVSGNLPTLLGVATGIAVLTGLLCFVLRLFSGNRFPPTRHYGNANLNPPLLYPSDNQWINGDRKNSFTEIPLTAQGRPSSRSSYQRSTTSLAQYPRNKGALVPPSTTDAQGVAAVLLIPNRQQAATCSDADIDIEEAPDRDSEPFSRMGSRKHSLTSVHSTSSVRSMSYSARRFEQENQQREQRAAAMKAAREEAARMAVQTNEDGISLMNTDPNEDAILCLGAGISPSQSEPPALLLQKVFNEDSVTSQSAPITCNK